MLRAFRQDKPNPEQVKEPLKPPPQHDPHPLKKELENREKKTGTR
jgi:hypothetical protein